MKFIPTIITGVIVGAVGVYFTLDWQEEKLKFSITDPAKFGNINYQNITLTNSGWNPAININILIEHSNIKYTNTQSAALLKPLENEKNGIAHIDRIRRNESIIISLAYEGPSLLGSEIKIASDRSIAEQIESKDKESSINFSFLIFVFTVFCFVFGIFAGVVTPAYRDYKKRAHEHENKAEI